MFKKIKLFMRLKGVALITSVVLTGVFVAGISSLSEAQEDGSADMRTEREQFVKEIRRVENLNKKYTQQIQDVKDTMGKQQQEFSDRINTLEQKISTQKTVEAEKKVETASQVISPEVEEATYNILSRGSELNADDETFRDELAKAHYNMGNIFFQRGEFQRAVVEYYQAVDLSPYDPDIHYNLAFVSGERLRDPETAMKHYYWYLYLKPDAEDKDLIKEKMAAAKLMINGRIDSPLDKNRGFEDVIR